MTDETREKLAKALSDRAMLRWGVLLLVSFAMAVNYYFYDVLSPIQEEIIRKLGLSESEYGGIIAAYSIPNTIFLMAAIGGMICDRLGIRLTGGMFFGSMVFGAFLTYYGTTDTFNQGGMGYAFLDSFWQGHSPSFKMMAIGFFFFGLGAETACVVISKAVIKWFKGKEMATALGVNVGIARVASSLTFSVGAALSDPVWNRPVLVGAILMTSGLLAFVGYMFFDLAYDRRAKARKEKTASAEDEFHLLDAFKLLLQPTYLFVVLLCVTFYAGVFPFNKYAVDLMQNKFLMSNQTAGLIVSILPLAQAAITPLFGLIFDLKGKGATLMIIGSLLLALGHGILSLTDLHPAVGLILLGMAFSLVPAVMWPALGKLVPESRLGSAYGMAFTIQNVGLMVITPLIGVILGMTNPGVREVKSFCGEAVENIDSKLEESKRPAESMLLDLKVQEASCAAFAKDGEKLPQDAVESAKKIATLCSGMKSGGQPMNWGETRQVCAKTTYDYKYSILMLSVFGFIGLIFAFLLKWADKKGGYGLELPNKAKK